MIVICPGCERRFRLDESKLPAGGARLRCSRCRHAFVLPAPSAAPEVGGPAPPELPVAATTASGPDPDPLDDLRFVEEPIGAPDPADGGEASDGLSEGQSLSFDTHLPGVQASEAPGPSESKAPAIARPTAGGTTIGEVGGASEAVPDLTDSATQGSTVDRIQTRDAQFDWGFDSGATAERSERDWGSTVELDSEVSGSDPESPSTAPSREGEAADGRADDIRPDAPAATKTSTRPPVSGRAGRPSLADSQQDAVDRTLARFLDAPADEANTAAVSSRPDPLGDPQSWDFLTPPREALPDAGGGHGAGPGDERAIAGGSPHPGLVTDPPGIRSTDGPSVLARSWARVRAVAWGELAGSALVVLLIAASAHGIWIRRPGASAPRPLASPAADLAALDVAELEARSVPSAFAGHLWVIRGSLRNDAASARRIASRVDVEPIGGGSPVGAGVGMPLGRLRTLRPAELEAWRREATGRLPELVLQPGERTRFQAIVRAEDDALAGFRLTAHAVTVNDPDLIGPLLAHPAGEATPR